MINRKGQNRVRIIGGVWRSRLVEFADEAGLRPSQDFVRETLFNWLVPVISGSRCLDLFAGSGVLGFESVSRGAAAAVLVDSNVQVTALLQMQKQKLDAVSVSIYTATAEAFLQTAQERFDVIFLDPPFAAGSALLPDALAQIQARHILNEGGRVYLECARQQALEFLSADWEIVRQKFSGEVTYMLLERKS